MIVILHIAIAFFLATFATAVPPSEGYLTCVDEARARHNVSSKYSWLWGEFAVDEGQAGVVAIDLVAATHSPVIIRMMASSNLDIFSIMQAEQHIGALPRGKDSISIAMGPSSGEYAILGAATMSTPWKHCEKWFGPSQELVTFSDDLCSQAAIWHYDLHTSQLTPHWVNSDLSTVPLRMFYDETKKVLGMSGNVTMFMEQNYPVTECTLKFVPAGANLTTDGHSG